VEVVVNVDRLHKQEPGFSEIQFERTKGKEEKPVYLKNQMQLQADFKW
jgi:hypothetical protein